MKKRGFLLLILIAILWWWHFYRSRKLSPKSKEIISGGPKRIPDMRKIEQKEKSIDERLLKQAADNFEKEFGRKPKNASELAKKGFISKDFLENISR
ncbi:MAG: hypothetical protein J7L54_02025 [Elusimicrobia bacterium]|nr:hypothetical protein [Elusimicrobiota bacterium]